MKRVVWVQVGAGALVVGPTLIVIWSGSVDDIPEGFYLCDGTHSTPDLRDRFVVGTLSTYSPEDSRTLGSTTTTVQHSHDLMIADESGHTHSIASGETTSIDNTYHAEYGGQFPLSSGSTERIGATLADGVTPGHGHSFVGAGLPSANAHGHSGSVGASVDAAAVDLLPAYYSLAYIMGSGDVPIGALAMVYVFGDPYGDWHYDEALESWVQGPSPLPLGYALCDGSSGTPVVASHLVLGVDEGHALGASSDGGVEVTAGGAHSHGVGTLATDSASHSHAPASVNISDHLASYETVVGMTLGGVYPLGPTHAHQPSEVMTTASEHSHGVMSVGSATAYSAVTFPYPPGYYLHWVMRQS